MFALKLYMLALIQDASDLVLGDIIEPNPVPFTYETIGWKIVFALVAILLIYIAYRLYKNYKKKQYLREAVAYIQNLEKQTDLDAAAYINAVMFQLKQTALHTFGRLEVASLHGPVWLQFLDSKVSGSNFKDDESLILEAVYKQEVSEPSAFNKEKFSNKSINWIKQHAR